MNVREKTKLLSRLDAALDDQVLIEAVKALDDDAGSLWVVISTAISKRMETVMAGEEEAQTQQSVKEMADSAKQLLDEASEVLSAVVPAMQTMISSKPAQTPRSTKRSGQFDGVKPPYKPATNSTPNSAFDDEILPEPSGVPVDGVIFS